MADVKQQFKGILQTCIDSINDALENARSALTGIDPDGDHNLQAIVDLRVTPIQGAEVSPWYSMIVGKRRDLSLACCVLFDKIATIEPARVYNCGKVGCDFVDSVKPVETLKDDGQTSVPNES